MYGHYFAQRTKTEFLDTLVKYNADITGLQTITRQGMYGVGFVFSGNLRERVIVGSR